MRNPGVRAWQCRTQQFTPDACGHLPSCSPLRRCTTPPRSPACRSPTPSWASATPWRTSSARASTCPTASPTPVRGVLTPASHLAPTGPLESKIKPCAAGQPAPSTTLLQRAQTPPPTRCLLSRSHPPLQCSSAGVACDPLQRDRLALQAGRAAAAPLPQVRRRAHTAPGGRKQRLLLCTAPRVLSSM